MRNPPANLEHFVKLTKEEDEEEEEEEEEGTTRTLDEYKASLKAFVCCWLYFTFYIVIEL